LGIRKIKFKIYLLSYQKHVKFLLNLLKIRDNLLKKYFISFFYLFHSRHFFVFDFALLCNTWFSCDNTNKLA